MQISQDTITDDILANNTTVLLILGFALGLVTVAIVVGFLQYYYCQKKTTASNVSPARSELYVCKCRILLLYYRFYLPLWYNNHLQILNPFILSKFFWFLFF